ncbi:pyridoxamine 5'-phosphate oxidase family protein [Streptomyces sp. A5-4]|uniref:pyridoxamine 5'-phosphate oxidase family protein n=1 Tax=Streptomyces sp. A5-4 TaxID=3384771 RepID=UPI003DA9C07A
MSHELREAARRLRERMLSAPPLSGPFPDSDVSKSPNVPGPLFANWLSYALDDGVPACHVDMLGTADAYGRPSARAIEITAVDLQRCRVVFSSDAGSRKGRDLAVNPCASLTWFWPRHGRQIRATGPVGLLGENDRRTDFRRLGEPGRAAAFTGRMSHPKEPGEDYDAARERAVHRMADDPDAVPETYAVYVVHIDEWSFSRGRPTTRMCACGIKW